MYLDGVLSAPLPVTYARHFTGSAAVQEPGLAPLDGPEQPAATAAASARRQPRDPEEQMAGLFGTNGRLTSPPSASDLAAVQIALGLRPVEDRLSVTDDEAELAIIEIPPQPERLPRDFSKAVADAVVTIEEYLDWVNEAAGQPA